MLFVPCRDGLSHHPAEYAEPAHLELACRVLADTLAQVAS
jgi:N-carbamoyl-L-amino-acid hydrolase